MVCFYALCTHCRAVTQCVMTWSMFMWFHTHMMMLAGLSPWTSIITRVSILICGHFRQCKLKVRVN